MTQKTFLDIPPQDLSEGDIIYDWNDIVRGPKPRQPIVLYDETLRDGIQSPSVVDPSLSDKIRILHLMDELGLDYLNAGLPGAGPRAVEDTREIVREIRDAKLSIKPSCAARTLASDIQPIIDISQELGVEIEVMGFIGSSAIRAYAEEWNREKMMKLSAEAMVLARKFNLPAC